MLAKLAAAVREQRVTAVELVGLARSADAVLAAGAAGDVTTTRVAETRTALGDCCSLSDSGNSSGGVRPW